jgi:hypothetical protein
LRIAGSEWLVGEAQRHANWLTFDWFLNENNLVKGIKQKIAVTIRNAMQRYATRCNECNAMQRYATLCNAMQRHATNATLCNAC